ncbi:heat shock factor 2-binding protein [Pelodytes ibericus]
MSGSSGAEFVRVRRRDLDRLTTEVMQMREFLPQILNPELVASIQRLEGAEKALEYKNLDCSHLQSRLEAAQEQCLQVKEERLSLLCQLSSLQEQSQQQVEFCSQMGSALCTLLWGVSDKEDAVRSILGGGKVSVFFRLASQTLSSYVESLGEGSAQDEDSEENQFVLGLAGTITNIAAVSCGREFLATSCKDLLETYICLLGEIRAGTCCRLRVLILMSLYNVSINSTGLSWMSHSLRLISQFQRLLSDPERGVCLHALRLLQSLLVESDILIRFHEEIHKSLPHIMELTRDCNTEIETAALELLQDIRAQDTKSCTAQTPIQGAPTFAKQP